MNKEQNPCLQPFGFGKVIQNQDSDHPNQVKIQIASLYEDGSNEVWAYLSEPYGGEQYGISFVPEVGEQVLVAMPFGEIPIVLSSVRGLKQPVSSENKDNLVKTIKTKGGNLIEINDEQNSAVVTIQTAGGNVITISDKDKKIVVASQDGKNSVTIDAGGGNVTVEAGSSLSLKAGGKEVLKADAGSLTLTSTKVSIKADSTLEANGAQLKLSGQTAEMSGTGQLNLSSSGITQLKGSLLKLNG